MKPLPIKGNKKLSKRFGKEIKIRNAVSEKKRKTKQIFMMRKALLNIEEKQKTKPRSDRETDNRSSIREQ